MLVPGVILLKRGGMLKCTIVDIKVQIYCETKRKQPRSRLQIVLCLRVLAARCQCTALTEAIPLYNCSVLIYLPHIPYQNDPPSHHDHH